METGGHIANFILEKVIPETQAGIAGLQILNFG
jgi:hypothetical protein